MEICCHSTTQNIARYNLQKYTHLEGVHMDREDMKAKLPIHIVLEASNYAKIKTENKPKIGRHWETVAELTQFGWTIMSPVKQVDISNMFVTQTAATHYEELHTRQDKTRVLSIPSQKKRQYHLCKVQAT